MKNKRNIFKILLKSKKVNNFTKLLIILNTLDYYEDYYIPNKKLMNQLNIHKKNLISLLKQLEKENLITIRYKNKKRYFFFNNFSDEEKKEPVNSKSDVFDYNWLDEIE